VLVILSASVLKVYGNVAFVYVTTGFVPIPFKLVISLRLLKELPKTTPETSSKLLPSKVIVPPFYVPAAL
jgi:hypothetical protein